MPGWCKATAFPAGLCGEEASPQTGQDLKSECSCILTLCWRRWLDIDLLLAELVQLEAPGKGVWHCSKGWAGLAASLWTCSGKELHCAFSTASNCKADGHQIGNIEQAESRDSRKPVLCPEQQCACRSLSSCPPLDRSGLWNVAALVIAVLEKNIKLLLGCPLSLFICFLTDRHFSIFNWNSLHWKAGSLQCGNNRNSLPARRRGSFEIMHETFYMFWGDHEHYLNCMAQVNQMSRSGLWTRLGFHSETAFWRDSFKQVRPGLQMPCH